MPVYGGGWQAAEFVFYFVNEVEPLRGLERGKVALESSLRCGGWWLGEAGNAFRRPLQGSRRESTKPCTKHRRGHGRRRTVPAPSTDEIGEGKWGVRGAADVVVDGPGVDVRSDRGWSETCSLHPLKV